MHRDLAATTPQRATHFNFSHPQAQEVLLEAAARAGATVQRGASVKEVRPGTPPTVVYEQGGIVKEVTARLVVGADGRVSASRQAPAFAVHKDPPFLLIAGVLLDNVTMPDDTGLIYLNPARSLGAYLFPQGRGRARAYAAYPASAGHRVQGERDLAQFIETSVDAGAPAALFEDVTAAGPLASFDAADTWVPHPYAGGIALVGDAASSNDPSWGQGLSLMMRDVRMLRDALLDAADWDEAGHAYAREHDRYYGVIHDVTRAFNQMFLSSGAQADACRARALPAIAQDPMRSPDHLFSGPDLPWNDNVRRVFFGEDLVA
jgi:2-polyprenyl-6-methoxyphenol hydroxylase-like FAD-dependent oxidoreductase